MVRGSILLIQLVGGLRGHSGMSAHGSAAPNQREHLRLVAKRQTSLPVGSRDTALAEGAAYIYLYLAERAFPPVRKPAPRTGRRDGRADAAFARRVQVFSGDALPTKRENVLLMSNHISDADAFFLMLLALRT